MTAPETVPEQPKETRLRPGFLRCGNAKAARAPGDIAVGTAAGMPACAAVVCACALPLAMHTVPQGTMLRAACVMPMTRAVPPWPS
jgi:hypothetical protein